MNMFKKVVISLFVFTSIAVVILLTRTYKADVAGRRLSSRYEDCEQILIDYAGDSPAEGCVCNFDFFRALVSLPKKKTCSVDAYRSWTRINPEDAADPFTFEKDTSLFGCNAHFSVGVNPANSKYVAVFVTMENPDGEENAVYKVFRQMWDAMMDGVGIANNYYIGGEESDQETVTALVERGTSDTGIAAVWPKNAMAWSVMLDYRVVDGKQQLGIYVL